MSDYAHNAMKLHQLEYDLQMAHVMRDAEQSVNAQSDGDECDLRIESIEEQIALLKSIV